MTKRFKMSKPASAKPAEVKGQQGKSASSSTTYKKCAHSHPPLPLGGDKVIYGGSCYSPIVPDIDISVALDSGWKPAGNMFPWQGRTEFLFTIQDMNVPSSLTQFQKLLAFLQKQIEKDKVVHVGCIGGHGRTGMVLSALVSQMMPEVESPTQYVRDNYCAKAVESAKQVDWLHEHFGIKKVKGAKEYLPAAKTKSRGNYAKASDYDRGGRYDLGDKGFVSLGEWDSLIASPKSQAGLPPSKYSLPSKAVPLSQPTCIWNGLSKPLTLPNV
jgi:hypothetical protein